jgi:hypothetical protein
VEGDETAIQHVQEDMKNAEKAELTTGNISKMYFSQRSPPRVSERMWSANFNP